MRLISEMSEEELASYLNSKSRTTSNNEPLFDLLDEEQGIEDDEPGEPQEFKNGPVPFRDRTRFTITMYPGNGQEPYIRKDNLFLGVVKRRDNSAINSAIDLWSHNKKRDPEIKVVITSDSREYMILVCRNPNFVS